MAVWTTPKTMNVGDPVISADFNTYVRDNMNVGRGYLKAQRTAGNITVSTTTWANVDTGIDLVLPAAVNDVIEATVDGVYTLAAGSAPLMDARFVNSSTYFGSAVETNVGSGVGAWGGNAVTGVSVIGGAFSRTVVSGDISAGSVTVRLRVRLSAAVNQTIGAIAATPLVFFLRNRGPAVNV